ncbi:MAG: exopolyphosphatase / guanosine-5-triphosphate,3-diphosphate pyrophosphatase [Solirubrobacteraceae bacterium]|nr:exopolyphosphatase / guanosine-5-triphosphate,3-diphosphate pyrophosphatase [Solirubrobacteraceae bacterium]
MSRSLPLPRCACIDVGSNTTRLLVAEADGTRLHELLAERAFTRLGATGAGEIGPHKIAEVAAVVARQARLARELGVDSMRVVATAAVREAIDRRVLVAAIGAACGATLEVLSAQDEARLAFHGAIGTLAAPPPGPLGVVDVGGGSTELIVGTAQGGVTWSVSLAVGSWVLTVADLPSDPPTGGELARLRDKLTRVFAPVQAPQPVAAYAVGGSATSMRRLMGIALGYEALERGLQTLVTRPAADVALRLGLHPERARLMPAGILLLDAAARALRAPLRLADGGLREGVVLEQLAALEGERRAAARERRR